MLLPLRIVLGLLPVDPGLNVGDAMGQLPVTEFLFLRRCEGAIGKGTTSNPMPHHRSFTRYVLRFTLIDH